MRLIVRLIRIYTPFICTLAALLNGVLLLKGADYLLDVYLLATFTGNSILVDLYMMVTSNRMCIWYKINLLCLLLIQVSGLLYNYFDIDESLYVWAIVLFAAIGVISFLIFRIFYNVTHLFGCSRRR